ncbi:MAG: ABC transporter ATP-binding protein [Muribaculaceae bacterium]|mgnify:FL=1|jgi:putative ABC transport system ATP-binding protein|nr:ABC transporter ATP-binding protein [Muribaculaceae bacterium]
METVIKLSDISKVYTTKTIETQALEGINLEVNKGEFLSIMGPSGCGKSTLLNIIGLLDRATSGDIRLFGKELSGLRDREMARFRNENLGFVFQSFHLIPTLNVIDNVMVPLTYRKGAGDRRKLAREALEKVGLSHRTTHFPAQLSGGQAQRVAIARAIVGNPSIILADEPTGNLDSKMSEEVMQLLHGLNNEGKTIIMVTHNEAQARDTDRVIHLFDGHLVL